MIAAPFNSVYDSMFDVIIFGAGYAGFAAAMELHGQAKQVLLVERSAAVLWESGWAFSTDAGRSSAPQWQQWVQQFRRCSAGDDGMLDGAVAEVLATQQLAESGPRVLYYVTPVAVHRDGDGRISAVAVAAKGGVRWLRSRQWIDATEQAELLRLIDPSLTLPAPAAQRLHLFFRGVQWRMRERELSAPDLPAAKLRFHPTIWANERCLTIDLPGDVQRPRSAWVPALTAAREQLADELAGAVLTHGSVVPLPVYAAKPARLNLPQNVVAAGAALASREVRSLADRFELGIEAAGQLNDGRAADAAAAAPPGSPEIAWDDERSGVAVAGIGTGGAIAAVAAARQGTAVTAFDPLPFAGGIGAGGGIHWYYYGVKGGLQEELDDRTRRIMPLFGPPAQVQGFHPDAKKLALEEMLVEAGVQLHYGATLFGAEVDAGRITHAHIAAPGRPIRLAADAWIDGTGDGDLAAHAGAAHAMGRRVDGQLHAYSQSSGRATQQEGHVRMRVVNYDAGFVDPTDEQDLTRARLIGIAHYVQRDYSDEERPTYIAPAIGLRQGRQIECDYMLTLADLIERREFPDAVGYTGAHYDNHAVDYQFESDEAMFWVWACEQWRPGRTACQIPLRMLLPRGVENLLLACRAAGVSEEAHHSFRMQRDIQRIGEVAGLAAARAASSHGGRVREVPIEPLQQQLRGTGALRVAEPEESDTFGPRTEAEAFAADRAADVQQWIGQARSAASPAMWHLYRHPEQAQAPVRAMLQEDDPGAGWRAAAILAMWKDTSAEPRLCEAIRRREYGFDSAPEQNRPERNNRLAPRWLVAVALLRRCGTPACLPALHELARDPMLILNARTAIALTCQALAERHALSPQDRELVAAILRLLWQTEPPDAVRGIQQHVVRTDPPKQGDSPTSRPAVAENFIWQLHFAVARAEEAAGLPVHPQVHQFLLDPRATVRRAMTSVTQRF